MGYCLKRLDEAIFMAGPKPMRTEFGIRQRLESCGVCILPLAFYKYKFPPKLERPITSTFALLKFNVVPSSAHTICDNESQAFSKVICQIFVR